MHSYATEEQLREKLKAIYKGQRHAFAGTIQRYVFKDEGPSATVNMWLIWKVNEKPD